MALIILHDLDGEEVMVNLETLTAAKRKYPDDKSQITEPFTKLYFISKDKTMESLGFPDTVKESPREIVELARKSLK